MQSPPPGPSPQPPIGNLQHFRVPRPLSLPSDTVSMMHCLFSPPPPRNEIELINHGGGLKDAAAAAPSDISEMRDVCRMRRERHYF